MIYLLHCVHAKIITCFIALTFKQFWIWGPQTIIEHFTWCCFTHIVIFVGAIRWFVFGELQNNKHIQLTTVQKNQDSKLLDHAHFTFILAKWVESDMPFWINICFLFFFQNHISKNSNNKKEWKKRLSHVHCSQKGRAARITLTIVRI